MNQENAETTDQQQPTADNQASDDSRRDFMLKVSLGLGGLAAAAVAVPVVGALIAPLLEDKPEVWRTVGTTDQFRVGSTTLVKFENADPRAWAGETARTAAWVRRESDEDFIAFSVNCTHLGCPVRWEAEADLFMCPCHGGVYYRDGSVAAGPPPKPLPRYAIRVAQGHVQIGTAPIPITNFSDGQ
ncbi:menaquinol-cytochrome c reductase iron-sulfur subunit [Spirosoma oryzae]|uniref:Menaquinol-cytochrome c reductase iron-sulfur subunit n=1 Tax=Spirosoma oryzae TaxID=1469603 RepID=A0A2T0SPU6_9BACT|nr:Rieske (2Fe-2S) protein [Spirosoma oryzae]PRY35437.1 menaquinol-cytochrome c reductase iron-sulfur subunit [Spirosoma oryzae]